MSLNVVMDNDLHSHLMDFNYYQLYYLVMDNDLHSLMNFKPFNCYQLYYLSTPFFFSLSNYWISTEYISVLFALLHCIIILYILFRKNIVNFTTILSPKNTILYI